MAIAETLTAALLLLCVYQFLLYPRISPLRHVPTPLQPPLWKRLFSEPNSIQFEQWIQENPEYKLIRYYGILNLERLLAVDPQAMREILQLNTYTYVKTPAVRKLLVMILGEGLIVAEGDVHRVQRKNLQPAFKPANIRELYLVFWTKTLSMVEVIEKKLLSSSAVSKEQASSRSSMDINGYLSRVGLDIIGTAGFGVDFGATKNPDSALAQHYLQVFSPSKGAQRLRILALILPGWFIDCLPSKRNKEIKIGISTIKNTTRDIIGGKKAAWEKSESSAAEDKDILAVAMKSGLFNISDLINQSMTFLGAGQETTASAMTWATYRLCHDETTQARLRDEIRSRIPSPASESATPVSDEMIKCMPYLGAVCNEILRLYAPVPVVKRVPIKATELVGTSIPAGTTVNISVWAAGRSVQHWGADAGEYIPERWLEKPNGGAKELYSFMTFSHGPRNCIGEKFARAEMACVLSGLFGRFKLTAMAPLDAVKVEHGTTTKIMAGLPVYVERIEGW